MLAPTFEPTVASVFAPRTTIDACGSVEGYASLFGEIDHARDMVMRGAFAETLATRAAFQCCFSTILPNQRNLA
jgi:Escherichia/Staphylococcus phage prohead protease